jgi:hypothetical protein
MKSTTYVPEVLNLSDKPVKFANALPYPSEAFYDAKLWQFCRKQGANGALI